MTDTSDQYYIDGLRLRDNQTIREIYQEFSGLVRSWVMRNNGNAADAQDLFQEALMAMYDRYGTGDEPFTGSFGGLLMTICKRRWYDRLQQKKRETDVRLSEADRYNGEDEPWEAAEEALAEKERQEGLSRVFSLLSEQCQKLLALFTTGTTSAEQLATELGMDSTNAVYQSKHRCISRWRQLYYEHHN